MLRTPQDNKEEGANAPPPLELFSTCFVLRNARALPLLPTALAFVPFEFVLVRVLPQVICGQPIGRGFHTQPVSNSHGARLMGTRTRRGQPNE